VGDEDLWTGPMGAFERNGFVEVHAFDSFFGGAESGPSPRAPAEPYPVLRRDLAPARQT
jgi:hypothetical protein